MLRMNIENTTRAKALIEFCQSHRDVARVSIFCIPQYTDMAKIFTNRELSVQLQLKHHYFFRIKLYFCENVNV